MGSYWKSCLQPEPYLHLFSIMLIDFERNLKLLICCDVADFLLFDIFT